MKIYEGENKIRKNKWKILFPIMHMAVSVLYAVFVFKHEKLPFGSMIPARDTVFSGECEKIVHIIMSGIFGFLLIYYVWYVFFLIIEKKKKLPFLLISISMIICLLVFPSNFSYEPDNLLSYSFAVRNMPDYWQSIYLGCLYRACLYIFPHPFTILFIQFSSLLGVIYYISEKVKKLYGKKASCVVWLVFTFPEFLEIGISPYRNCIYTVMCLWFFAVLFLDYLEKKKRTAVEMFLICAIGGFLAVFRSEGIIVLGVLIVALLLSYKFSLKEFAKALAIMLCVCVIFAVPQKLGEKKYYGKDYSMINCMNILKDILSDKNVDLGFDTVERDLTAINQVVSLEGLMVFGIHEYRAQNFIEKNSINQSFSSQKEQDAFIEGARNIILHNLGLYFKDRLIMFCVANGIDPLRQEPYPTEEWNRMFASLTSQWNYSYNEIITDSYPGFLFQNERKVAFSDWLTDLQINYYNFVCGTNILFISRILVFLLFPILVLYNWKISKMEGQGFFIWTAFLLLIQLAIIILFCPEERGVYYYSVFFVMLLGCFLLILEITKKSRVVKAILPPVINTL